MIRNAHAADHRSQAITLPEATSHREFWSQDELDFVLTFENERDEEIALALGRTLYAVRGIRGVLHERRAVRRPVARREVVVTSYDEWERSFD